MTDTVVREHIIRTSQLQVGDVWTESITFEGYSSRAVVVTSPPVLSEMFYRGEFVPAYFVQGWDARAKKAVKTFASLRRLWSVNRTVNTV